VAPGPTHPPKYSMSYMPNEEPVRELSAQLLAAQDQETINRIGSELRQALREHIEQLRKKLVVLHVTPPNKDRTAD
jgi:hypothetical protein